MPQTTIRYSITPNGTVEEIVEGVKGHACDSLTKPIEESLGEVLTHLIHQISIQKCHLLRRNILNI